MYMLS